MIGKTLKKALSNLETQETRSIQKKEELNTTLRKLKKEYIFLSSFFMKNCELVVKNTLYTN